MIDELAGKLGMDPIELRLKNAAKEGTKTAYGPTFGPIGIVETLEAAKATRTGGRRSSRTRAAASPPASGSTSAARRRVSLSLNEDGTLSLTAGSPTSAARAPRCA